MTGATVFISPAKTSTLDDGGAPVQKCRTNMSLPAATVLGAVEAAGLDTHFLDLTAESGGRTWMVGPRVLAYGLSDVDAVTRIAELEPRFVLVSSMFTFEQTIVDDLVCAIKRSLPNVCVVVGGIHASCKPEWHFEESGPDFIVIGEGEDTIGKLLKELSCKDPDPRRVAGIAFQGANGEIERTRPQPPLEHLDRPWCLKQVLMRADGRPRYIERECRKSPIYVADTVGEDVATFAMLGSRGCPHCCRYCTATPRTGRPIRHMGADRMFSQLLTVRQRYGVAVFCNQADTFGVHPDDVHFLEMVREYRRSSGDQCFVLNNPNAFFLQQFFPSWKDYELDLEFLDLLVDAGFNVVTVAIETLNQRFNGKVNCSKIRPEQLIELCQAVRERGMRTDIYMMYGFPDQTIEEFEADLEVAERLLPWVDLITWNSLSLLPGTSYYEHYVVRAGKESAYRKVIREGYGCYCPIEEFNLSRVSVQRFRDALAPFGQSWI